MIKECHGYIIITEPLDKHACNVRVCQSKDRYQDFGDMTSQQLLETIDVSERPLMHGNIKWDNCGNFNWNPQNYATHFCGPKEFIELIEAVWKYANEELAVFRPVPKDPL